MKKILTLFFIWFGFLLIINKFSPHFLTNRTDYELYHDYAVPLRATVMPWLNFDARHYLDIAVNGSYEPVYMNVDGIETTFQHVRRVYFPLFPFVTHFVTFGGVINPVFMGLLLNYALTIGSLYVMYKLFAKEFSEKVAIRSITLLLLFPTSFYLVAYYSEALYLFLTLLVFYFLHSRKYVETAVSVALASLTRLVGIALLPVLLYDIWCSFKKDKRIPFMYALAPLGVLSYLAYSYFDTGNAMVFLSSMQSDTFAREPSLFGPLLMIRDLVGHVLTPGRHVGQMHRYLAEIMELVSVIVLVGATYIGFTSNGSSKKDSVKPLKKTYIVYMVSYILIMLVSGSTTSLHRYVMVVFPIYPVIAQRLSEKQYYAWLAVSGVLFVILSSLFLRGYWVT